MQTPPTPQAPAANTAAAAAPTRPGMRGLAHQMGLLALFALAYFGIRGITQGSTAKAFSNADALTALEATLGIAWEDDIQRAVINHPDLVTLANWIYIYGHWPVIVTTLVWLYLRRPAKYYLLRNAIFLSGALGMIVFMLLPMAPPRFGVIEVIDTVSDRSEGYRALQPPALTNKYAAMPSLHFGWNLLVGMILWESSRRRSVRVFAVAMPIAMAWAVVNTGNHYVLDVIAGGIVALAGFALAMLLPRVVETPHWAREPG